MNRLFTPDAWWSTQTQIETAVADGVIRCGACGDVFLAPQLVTALKSSSDKWSTLDSKMETDRRRQHADDHVKAGEAQLVDGKYYAAAAASVST